MGNGKSGRIGEWEMGRVISFYPLVLYTMVKGRQGWTWGTRGTRKKKSIFYLLITYYLLLITYYLNQGWGEWERESGRIGEWENRRMGEWEFLQTRKTRETRENLVYILT